MSVVSMSSIKQSTFLCCKISCDTWGYFSERIFSRIYFFWLKELSEAKAGESLNSSSPAKILYIACAHQNRLVLPTYRNFYLPFDQSYEKCFSVFTGIMNISNWIYLCRNDCMQELALTKKQHVSNFLHKTIKAPDRKQTLHQPRRRRYLIDTYLYKTSAIKYQFHWRGQYILNHDWRSKIWYSRQCAQFLLAGYWARQSCATYQAPSSVFQDPSIAPPTKFENALYQAA